MKKNSKNDAIAEQEEEEEEGRREEKAEKKKEKACSFRDRRRGREKKYSFQVEMRYHILSISSFCLLLFFIYCSFLFPFTFLCVVSSASKILRFECIALALGFTFSNACLLAKSSL